MAQSEDTSNRLVSWLEKKLKTDIRYLLQGGSWLLANQFFSSGAAFILSLGFANLVAPATYGIYKYVLSVLGLLLIPTLPGIDPAVSRSVARGYEGTLMPALKIKMAWGTLGAAAAFAIAFYYYIHGNIVMCIAFCIAAIFIPFNEAFDIYNSLLNGKKLFGEYSRWNSIQQVLTTIALLITLTVTKSIYAILAIYFLSAFLMNGFYLLRATGRFLTNPAIDPEAIPYGKHLSVITIVGTILDNLDSILVFHLLGPVDLAIYTFANAPTDQIKGLFKNVTFLAMPRFSARNTPEIKQEIGRKTLLLTMAVLAAVLGYIIIAPFAFRIFFHKYFASVIYSQVLALSLVGSIGAMFLSTVLEAQKDTRGLYKYNFGTSIINIIILFPLIYYFGIWGAIATRMIIRFASFAYSYILVRKMPAIKEGVTA